MDAEADLKAGLPSRHVTEGPERAAHRSVIRCEGPRGGPGRRPRGTGFTSGYLWKYAQQVGSALGGAVTRPGPWPRQGVMRILDFVVGLVVLGVGVGLGPASGLEGSRPAPDPVPVQCAPSLRPADATKTPGSLQYAAEQGNPVAQWKLGHMYAKGEGVPRCDLRAFEYFSRIANGHADDYPDTPQAPFVANAFVALGQYYLDGIPNSEVKPDLNRARQMFSYAASYFGNADAQYHLARLYLDGQGVTRDPKLAARWLGLAAKKGQVQAQAVLGYLLFKGDAIPRQPARGLMWLTLARDGAGPDDKWITDLYDSAFKQANDDDRATALTYLERWLKTQKE